MNFHSISSITLYFLFFSFSFPSTLFSMIRYQHNRRALEYNRGARNKTISRSRIPCIFKNFYMIRDMDLPNYTTHNEDIGLVDCATTHTILWDKNYFSNLTFPLINVNTISGFVNLIQGFKRVIIILLGGIKFTIDDAFYSAKSKRNFLSFKDISWNRYHIQTMKI